MKKLMIAFVLVFAVATTSFAREANHGQISALTEKNQTLINELQNPELEKRVKAAQELGEKQVVHAVDSLIDMMQNDAEFQARIVAAMSLMEIGDVRALDAIKKQAQVDERRTVRTALKGIVMRFESEIS